MNFTSSKISELDHSFEDSNSSKLQNLELNRGIFHERIPDELKDGINDLLKNSQKLHNLCLKYFNERDLEEIEFPTELSGLHIRNFEGIKNVRRILEKIENEISQLENFSIGWIKRQDELDSIKKFTRICQDMKQLKLSLAIERSPNVSFLRKFLNLKELHLKTLNNVEIDLFELFSFIPKIETLHLDGFRIKNLKEANLSSLKNFGLKLIPNKKEVEENLKKFKCLQELTIWDGSSTHDTLNLLLKILPHLEKIETIEFVYVDYKDSFYEEIKSLTQNRTNKLRIKMGDFWKEIIPEDNNDKFIIEEWSEEDWEKMIWMKLF